MSLPLRDSPAESDGHSTLDEIVTVDRFTGLRARFHEPGPLFTGMMVLPDPAIASILGWSGADYVMLDAEHGTFTSTSLRACIEALKATSARVVVRTASSDAVNIQQPLDLGADGVLIPRVESAEDAAAVVQAARYPPEGKRGVSPAVRAARYGLDGESYLAGANASIAVLVIIETVTGVDNAKEIARVPGLDGIMVGTTDLAADMGLTGTTDGPLLEKAVESVTRCALDAAIKIGTGGSAESGVRRNHQLVYCFTDALDLGAAVRGAVARARGG